MMGIDDILISFGMSYLAGNVPRIKEWIDQNKDVQEQIDECYNKALKRWSVNCGVREYEQLHKYQHLDELQQALSGKKIESSIYAELIQLWLDEMRKNDTCYHFILEHKMDLQSSKLDAGFSSLAQLVKKVAEKTEQKLDTMSANMEQLMADMAEIKAGMSANSIEQTVEKLKELLSGSVNELIEKLFFKSAYRLIKQMEELFADEIKKDNSLAAQLYLLKGNACSLDEKAECYELYHKAYLLDANNPCIKEKEVVVLLRKSDKTGAIKLGNSLPDESILKQAILVAFSDNPEQQYAKLDENKKKNYSLRYTIFSFLASKNIDVAFLFSDDKVKVDDTLHYRNLLSWLYVVNFYNLKTGNYLFISPVFQTPSVFQNAFYAANKLYELLSKTEISDQFPMLKAQCSYWGYVVDRHPSRITLIQEVDPNELNREHKQMLAMMQASMHAIAGEYDEAVSLLAAYDGDINNDIVNMTFLLAYYSNTVRYLEWIIGVVKEKGIKIESFTARHLASCINEKSAHTIGGLLTNSIFNNQNDAVVLAQLCNYYGGLEVDVDTLKRVASTVSDDMLPYAAFVLANREEEKIALELLKPKVDLQKNDTMLRVYIEVLSKIPEEKPNLYHILVDKRKSGVVCDDAMLFSEFTLDVKVADFQNAYEAISILYTRYPDDETIFVNYLLLLGRHHPKELEKLKDKVSKFEYSSPRNVINIYMDYADNDYIEFAAEFLYNHTRISDDWALKDTYIHEGLMGKLRPIVQERFKKAEEGNFVLCVMPNDSRKIYQAKKGNPVGELLLGKKENDVVKCEIAGEDTELTIVHIMNKFGKLSCEITQEIMDGDNPNSRPYKMDVNNPVESVEALIEKISPGSSNYYKDKLEEQKKYEEGELGLVSMISPNEILEGYYGKLLSSSKTYVMPWQQCQLLFLRGRNLGETRYVLDISAVVMLFEFQLLSGYSYQDKFIVGTSLYEYLVACSKNTIRLTSSSIFEAFKNPLLKRYDKYVDLDLQQRIPALVKWIEDSCEIVVPDKTLAMTGRNISNELGRITTDALSLMLEENRVFLSDDRTLIKMMNYSVPIVTTETYMRLRTQVRVKAQYSEFLMNCNYMGIEISADKISSEYFKMESGADNKFSYIIQNAAYNPYLTTEEVKGCVEIARAAKNAQQANIMITYMMVSMIKSLDVKVKSSVVSKTLAYLSFNYPNFADVKQCLRDAAKICNVILLPTIFMN